MNSPIIFFLLKALISGLMVAIISAVAKAFPKWAALLTALPVITFLSLIWIYLEKKDLALLEVYVLDVLLWTLPGILFFITAFIFFRMRLPFFLSLAAATLAMGLGLYGFHKLGILRN